MWETFPDTFVESARGPAQVDPARAIMIGDRSHDMIGARANGMTAVGVLYGYGSREELLGAGAHQLSATGSRKKCATAALGTVEASLQQFRSWRVSL